jgi:tight adherence protein B
VTPTLVGVLALAFWLALSPPGSPGRRLRLRVAPPPGRDARVPAGHRPVSGAGPARGRVAVLGRATLSLQLRRSLHLMKRTPHRQTDVPLALLVEQSAALLRGGRDLARLWDELWLLYGGEPSPGRSASGIATLAPASRANLAAARAAAGSGAPMGAAIRSAATGRASGAAAPGRHEAEEDRRAWIQFAACFDVAEASGCPLADVLTRFAAQLEAEDDAEAARQTALAGPRATVRLLSWLPILGLGLGMALGVDPMNILLGEPAGIAALAAGFILTAAGRIWSARLVRAAAGRA